MYIVRSLVKAGAGSLELRDKTNLVAEKRRQELNGGGYFHLGWLSEKRIKNSKDLFYL